MATTDTFDMAASPVVCFCLYGDLQRFGRRFRLQVKDAAEAIRALSVQLPGFRQMLSSGWYQLRIAGRDTSEQVLHARLHESLRDGDVIHLVPRTEGAKSGGVFQVVAGAVLTVAGAVISYFSAGTLSAFGAGMMKFGVAMMIGGVAQMLAPKPKTPEYNSADNGKQNTYFSSLDNMIAQGNPMPVPYGEMLVGSRRISQDISTRDEGGDGQAVVIGRG
ncbi:tail assembly protein [Escherichia coli]|uniref:tail assembly protein n=1 Tax=Escherichia coli TaxID=562 RepID=UPI00092D4DF3|nr:tail assembly protein [Escherichia coli]